MKGLILGKFMPLHQGHIGLIEFALQYCEHLIILVCATTDEPIDGQIRLSWVKTYFKSNLKVQVEYCLYDDNILPNTSVSSRKVSAIWANYLQQNLPPFDIIFTSEKYGNFVAKELNIRHIQFDKKRNIYPISASAILEKPLTNWMYIPSVVRPYFVKKIVLLGTESTGKSMLTVRLATYLKTSYVPEMARHLIEKTIDVEYRHLEKIALLHAETIMEKTSEADKILLIDTDVHITASYARYLFNKDLIIPDWIRASNKANLYFYLDKDAPFIQDGTRLDKSERDNLDTFHQNYLKEKNIDFTLIKGSWDERFETMRKKIEAFISQF